DRRGNHEMPDRSAPLCAARWRRCGDAGPAEDDCTYAQRSLVCTRLRSTPVTDGKVIIEDMRMALCRCGQLHHKPFCDNSHRGSGFKDSGAVENGGARSETQTEDVLSITTSANGPLLADGPFVLRGADGVGRHEGTYAELCRCGASRHKPFCDATHEDIGFRTEETTGA